MILASTVKKRRCQRRPAGFPVTVFFRGLGSGALRKLEGKAINVSETGMLLEMPRDCAGQRSILTDFHVPPGVLPAPCARRFRLKARVVRSQLLPLPLSPHGRSCRVAVEFAERLDEVVDQKNVYYSPEDLHLHRGFGRLEFTVTDRLILKARLGAGYDWEDGRGRPVGGRVAGGPLDPRPAFRSLRRAVALPEPPVLGQRGRPGVDVQVRIGRRGASHGGKIPARFMEKPDGGPRRAMRTSPSA